MSKSVFITTPDSYSGKSIVSIGIMQMILQNTTSVAYFRPIIDDPQNEKKDNHITTIVDYFNLEMKYEEAYAFNRKQVLEMTENNQLDLVFERIIEKYENLKSRYEFVLIEGTDFFKEASSFEVDLNISVAKKLNSPIILILNADQKSEKEVISHFWKELNPLLKSKLKILSVIINKYDDNPFRLNEKIKETINEEDFGVFTIPPDSVLALPTVLEIKNALHARFVFMGEIENMNLVPQRILVGGMFLQNFINHIDNNSLALIPGDRADLLVGTLLANRSKNYPKVAGIVLTGGLVPERSVIKLIEGIQNLVPIMTTKLTSFKAASIVAKIKSKIQPESLGKIRTSIQLFNVYISKSQLQKIIHLPKINQLTPQMFLNNLEQEAKSAQRHIVLPEGNDDRILKVSSRIAREKIAYLTILGDEDEIMRSVNRLGIYWDIDRIRIINPHKSDKLESFAKDFYELRKDKGISYPKALDLMYDPTYFGTMMVYKGLVDGMVAGVDHATSQTIKPAFQIIKAKLNFKTISSILFVIHNHKVVVYSDCAIISNPSAEQLADIALASIKSASDFGLDPSVAMLISDEPNPNQLKKVKQAIEIIRENSPDFDISEPIKHSEVIKVDENRFSDQSDRYNVFIFPTLELGNKVYVNIHNKTNAISIGPLMQGLRKPINDLPRNSKIEDIYNTIIFTTIQSEKY